MNELRFSLLYSSFDWQKSVEWPQLSSLHCKRGPNDHNLPPQHIPTLLAQHVALVWPPCCDMSGVVGSNLTLFKLEPITRNMSQHIATRHVAIVWPGHYCLQFDVRSSRQCRWLMEILGVFKQLKIARQCSLHLTN